MILRIIFPVGVGSRVLTIKGGKSSRVASRPRQSSFSGRPSSCGDRNHCPDAKDSNGVGGRRIQTGTSGQSGEDSLGYLRFTNISKHFCFCASKLIWEHWLGSRVRYASFRD